MEMPVSPSHHRRPDLPPLSHETARPLENERTTDMVFPPLSPSVHWGTEIVTPSIMPAFEYISSKLRQKMLHVTLLVGRGAPSPAQPTGDQLMVIPTTSLEEPSKCLLYHIVAKAGYKFPLGSSWINALVKSQNELHVHQYMIRRSIQQNEVLFSSEGLTLLNIDRIYTLKRQLCILSHQSTAACGDYNNPYVASCVQLLHHAIADFQGQPFSKAFFYHVYEQLYVRDDILTWVARVYHEQYKQEGIVLPAISRETASSESEKPALSPNTATTSSGLQIPIAPATHSENGIKVFDKNVDRGLFELSYITNAHTDWASLVRVRVSQLEGYLKSNKWEHQWTNIRAALGLYRNKGPQDPLPQIICLQGGRIVPIDTPSPEPCWIEGIVGQYPQLARAESYGLDPNGFNQVPIPPK